MADEKNPNADETAAEQPLSKKQLKKQLKKQKRREKYKDKWEKQRRLLFPANKKGRHIMRRMNVLRFLCYPVYRFFYPHKFYGPSKVGDGACIYVANHYNIFDIFFTAQSTKEGVHFLAKQSILEAPFIGGWARKLGVIGAMRDGSDVRTIMESMKVLKNGEKISLYPEGTRNKVDTEHFLPFRGGAALLAIRTKTPIVPYVICSPPRLFKKIHVVFGEPFELSEYYDKKLTPEDFAEADKKLEDCLYRLRDEHRAMLAEKKNKKKKPKKSKEKGE